MLDFLELYLDRAKEILRAYPERLQTRHHVRQVQRALRLRADERHRGEHFHRDTVTREQFGEPIAHRQSIAFMLAEMAIEVDAARLMVWEAAWKLDRDEDATEETTVMKYYVDNMVLQVADRAVQTLGGYGYIREYPVELWLRNARGFANFDGLAMV